MGRCVYCDGEFVWKYAFAAQNSEQYRIHKELGLGDYTPMNFYEAEGNYTPEEIEEGKEEGWINADGLIEDNSDTLTLSIDDIPALENFLQTRNFESLDTEYDNIFKRHNSNANKGILLGSPLHDELKEFTEKYDFYYLAMIHRYVAFMKEQNNTRWKTVFDFNGEF